MKSLVALAVTLSLLPLAPALAGGAVTSQMRSAPPVVQKSVSQKSGGSGPSWKTHRKHGRHGKGPRHRALPVIVEERAPAARAQAPAPDLRITGIVAARSAGSPSYYSSWAAACEALHPGFDPRTGTYVARDGSRRRCD